MITYDEVVAALYLMEITADLIVFETNQKIVHDYITQQQTKDRRLKKIEELLGLYRDMACYVGEEDLPKSMKQDYRKLLSQINNLEKELEERK